MRRLDASRVRALSIAATGFFRAAMTLVLIGLFSPALPAFNVWVGSGINNNWTTSANWSPFFGPPPNDGSDDIVLQGTTRLTPIVNQAQNIDSLMFNSSAGAFVILGPQELTIGAGGITNNDTDIQSVFAPVELSVGHIWNAAAGRLQMDAVNLNGFTLALVGAHPIDLLSAITGTGRLEVRDTYFSTVTMSGGNNNTYTGETVVAGGTLRLQKTSGAIAVAGNLGVNSGGSVVLGDDEQISHAPGTEVTVGHPFTIGSLNLNGFNETIYRLDVQGGSVTTGAGTLSIGQSLSVRTADASITGNLELGDVSASVFADGQVATSRAITIGEAGIGSLSINSGGDVTNGQASIGNQAGSTGSVYASNDSTWTNNGQLYIGNGGGGILNIESGGDVRNGGSFIGNESGATGAVTVNGAGSTWTNDGVMYAGVAGTGTLDVTAGGVVSSNFGIIGALNVSNGHITVDGSGSVWTNASFLTLGYGMLDITDSGQVAVGGDTTINSSSEINVSGAMFDVGGNLTVNGGSLTADAGAIVEVGYATLKTGATLDVQNQSEFTDLGGTYVESGVVMRVNSGARYSTQFMAISNTPGPAAELIVDGADTLVTSSSCCIDVGYGGTGVMTVTRGARIETGTGAVGSFAYGTAPSIGTLTLDGTDANGHPSSWIIGAMNVGLHATSQGTIQIRNGAQFRATSTDYGLAVGTPGTGIVMVEGADAMGNPSLLDAARLSIGTGGYGNGTGEVTASSGARIDAGNIVLAATGGTATLTVTDANSALVQSGTSSITVGHATDGSAVLNVRNGATFITGTGAIDINATGEINLESGADFDARGPININGGQFNFLGGTLHVATFNGNLLNQGGALAPGHSAGATAVSGNYTQRAAAALEIEIGGVLAGDWDVLTAQGNASLNGTLEVVLIDDFEPVIGNSFTIITTNVGNVGGQFDTELFPIFNGLTFDVIYQSQSVVLQVIEATTLPGDYNHDGKVDAADYVVWRKTDGMPTGYEAWSTHFGQTAGGGAGANANTTVPEPAAMVMLIVTAAGAFTLRRRLTCRVSKLINA